MNGSRPTTTRIESNLMYTNSLTIGGVVASPRKKQNMDSHEVKNRGFGIAVRNTRSSCSSSRFMSSWRWGGAVDFVVFNVVEETVSESSS